MRIIEFNEKYKEQTVKLLIDVAVEEHGFKEWKIWFKKFNNEHYNKNNGNCWIALDENDKVVGTISLRNIDNISCELKNLYIKKEYRRKGIAKSLFELCIEFAKKQGYERIQLDTYDNFGIAMKFYERNGFAMEKKIVENGKNIYIYSKFLKQELISVIVPIYNVKNYVEDCIKSIINQTYKNLQIILVDDGSTDESGKICDNFAIKDERIKVIHKLNGGLADARNVGIKNSIGDYISFIDGDDFIYPTFYEELYDLLREQNADIAECSFLRIKEDIKKAEKIIFNYNNFLKIENKIQDGMESLKELYGIRLNPYVKKVVVWNKLYKKDIFKNIEFPKGKLHEDEFTTYKILNNCKKMISTNKVLYGYMQTNNSIMRSKINIKRINDNLEAYIESAVFFEENGNSIIESYCWRRYLENCIELSGKVLKQQNVQSEKNTIIKENEYYFEILNNIANLYKKYYEKYIDVIIQNNNDKQALEIIELLQKTYSSLENIDYIEQNNWDKLEIIVNKS